MKFVSFRADGRASIGAVCDRGIVDLAELISGGSPQDMLVALIDRFDELRHRIEALVDAAPALPVETVALGPSVPAPTKLLCVMRNRPALSQSEHPFAYLKCSQEPVGTGQVLHLPRGESELRHAPEVAAVIRGPVRHLPASMWRTAVFGYTLFLDTIRPSSMFTAGSDAEDWWKSWDTPWAVGPCIVTEDAVADAGQGLTLSVSRGAETVEVRDPGQPSLPGLIAFLSSVMTLRTGDVIACGAHDDAVLMPAVPGSRVELTAPGIGSLAVEVQV